MKYAMDTPFGIFKQVPREPLQLDDQSKIRSLVGVGLAVEECDTFPDPMVYLKQFEVWMSMHV